MVWCRSLSVQEAELLDQKREEPGITEQFQCPLDLEEPCLWLRRNRMMSQLVNNIFFMFNYINYIFNLNV